MGSDSCVNSELQQTHRNVSVLVHNKPPPSGVVWVALVRLESGLRVFVALHPLHTVMKLRFTAESAVMWCGVEQEQRAIKGMRNRSFMGLWCGSPFYGQGPVGDVSVSRCCSGYLQHCGNPVCLSKVERRLCNEGCVGAAVE